MTSDRNQACPGDCAGCPSIPEGGTRLPRSQTPSDLHGGRFVLAALHVFVAPLFALLAAQLWLAERLGELGAFGAGLGAAGVLLLPAWRRLRRR